MRNYCIIPGFNRGENSIQCGHCNGCGTFYMLCFLFPMFVVQHINRNCALKLAGKVTYLTLFPIKNVWLFSVRKSTKHVIRTFAYDRILLSNIHNVKYRLSFCHLLYSPGSYWQQHIFFEEATVLLRCLLNVGSDMILASIILPTIVSFGFSFLMCLCLLSNFSVFPLRAWTGIIHRGHSVQPKDNSCLSRERTWTCSRSPDSNKHTSCRTVMAHLEFFSPETTTANVTLFLLIMGSAVHDCSVSLGADAGCAGNSVC